MANKRHRGVRLLSLSDGKRHVARFSDPVSGRVQQVDLLPLGLTNEHLRTRWAIEKATALAKLRAQVSASGASAVLVDLEQARVDYLATFANPLTKRNKTPPLVDAVAFLREQGAASVQDITGPMLATYGDHIRRPQNEHLPRTRNLRLQAVAAWLRWCRRRGWLPRVADDAVADALYSQKVPRDAIDVLQPAQCRQLLAAARAHDNDENGDWQAGPIVLLLLLSGMRWAEGAGLLWSEVDLPAKCLRLGSGRTKTETHRIVTLAEAPAAVDLLASLRLRAGKEPRVFPLSLTRDRCEAMRERLQKHFGAPEGWTWHQLRRTCGSLLVCGGLLGPASPFLTAKRLGHGLAVSERAYLGTFRELPAGATTIEQAGQFEREAAAIVRAVAGVVADEKATAATG